MSLVNWIRVFFTEIIKSRSVMMTEEEKFDAVLRWVKHDVESRRADLVDFLECVNLKFVSIERQQQLVSDDSFNGNMACVRNLCSSVINSLKFEIKWGKEKAIVIFDNKSLRLQQFKPRSNSWRQMHQMEDELEDEKYMSAVVHGDYFYVLTQNKEVFCIKYNDKAATWEKIEENYSDLCPPVVVKWRKFYTIGEDIDWLTKCFQRFDPESLNWSKLQERLNIISGLTLLVMGNFIYSFGGRQGSSGRFIDSVQRFDPTTSEWMRMEPMRQAKAYMTAVGLNNKAYVMGGFEGNFSASVDCYDPEMNQWTNLEPMRFPRSLFRAFVIDGSIYAVGGFYCSIRSTSNIEKYDVEKNEWTNVLMPGGMRLDILDSVEIMFE